MSFSGYHLAIGALMYAVPVALALVGLYFVLRFAIRSALRDHQVWLDSRSVGGDTPQP